MRIISVLIFSAILFASGCSSLNGTSWTLVELKGQIVKSDSTITINFENDQIYGSDGCNRYSAPVIVKNSKMSFDGKLSTTMMACSKSMMQQADEFVSALKQAAAYQIDGGKLTLVDAGDHDLATFIRKTNRLGESEWLAMEYNNGRQAMVSLIRDTEIIAVFGTDGNLSGFAGCNRYISPYTVSGDAIRIGLAATTRKSCAEPPGLMEQERLFLRALETADTYYIRGDHLELRTTDGALAVIFVLSIATPEADNH